MGSLEVRSPSVRGLQREERLFRDADLHTMSATTSACCILSFEHNP